MNIRWHKTMRCTRFPYSLLLSVVSMFLFSCKPASEPIYYGEEKCAFCTMTIMDPRYGSEIVTNKGKVIKFDAMECMIHYIRSGRVQEQNISLMLTNSYDRPGELIDARSCFYLQSHNLPSPMGMNLSAFSDSTAAARNRIENPGVLFRYSELNGLISMR